MRSFCELVGVVTVVPSGSTVRYVGVKSLCLFCVSVVSGASYWCWCMNGESARILESWVRGFYLSLLCVLAFCVCLLCVSV